VQDFTIRLVLERERTIEFFGPGRPHQRGDRCRRERREFFSAGRRGRGWRHSSRRAGLRSSPNADKSSARLEALPAGQAVITTGGKMAAKYVIHTVGPIYRGGEIRRSPKSWRAVIANAIRLADDTGCNLYRFLRFRRGLSDTPSRKQRSSRFLPTIEALVSANHLSKVRFVLFDIATLKRTREPRRSREI